MDIVPILMVLVAVKFVIIAVLLGIIFRQDIRRYREERHAPSVPQCMYCQSKWTQPIDEGQTRWDGDELVLVTGYECQHCHLPFWHVDRVPMGAVRR